jgi:hypothetical protein
MQRASLEPTLRSFEGQSKMKELVLTCVLALLGSGCVNVVSHRDEFDAGPDTAPSDAKGEPEAASGKCSSGVRWTQGTMASPAMTPGRACMGSGCHTPNSKRPFTLAGTLYPLGGERDENDCNGEGANGAVIPLDENMMEIPSVGRLIITPMGNFFTDKPLPPTFRVKVAVQGREAVMVAPVTNGDCNFCHSPDDFMMAKGRIVPKAP